MSAAAAPALSSVAAEKPHAAEETPNQNRDQQEDQRWLPLLSLPCELTVELAVPNFNVADFLALRSGSVLSTDWQLARDIPLRINGTLIGWGEFEGAGNRLAVRLTELA